MPIPECCGSELTSPIVLPTLPDYSQVNYREALLDLLPSGRAWGKGPVNNLSKLMGVFAGTYRRDVGALVGDNCSAYGSGYRALDLLRGTMPFWAIQGASAVTDMLPEWQALLGLPDPCLGEDATLDQQVRQAVARFVALGGQSICYYVRYARNLGYDITITEYAPFVADMSSADSTLADEDSIYYWQVSSADDGSWEFQADLNVAGDPLGDFGNDVLECELNAIAPLHTRIVYVYTTPPGINPLEG